MRGSQAHVAFARGFRTIERAHKDCDGSPSLVAYPPDISRIYPEVPDTVVYAGYRPHMTSYRPHTLYPVHIRSISASYTDMLHNHRREIACMHARDTHEVARARGPTQRLVPVCKTARLDSADDANVETREAVQPKEGASVGRVERGGADADVRGRD